MTYTTLISTTTVSQNLNHPDWVIIDCRFSLADTEAGGQAYRHGHIPTARYASLNKDLSSTITDFTGRHPLPDFTVLTKKLGHWGISNNTQVVVYDDTGGAFAARLWWLLRCLGHHKVAVLNGGYQQWKKQGLPINTTLPGIKPTLFRPYLNSAAWLSATQVQNSLAQKSICLVDARTPERYRGAQEPIDSVAGHIPYAVNREFQLNLDSHGLFLPVEKLREQFSLLLGANTAKHVVHYCGSGVTACHNLLAMEQAGLTGSRLYAGSWSEWIRNKNRAVVKNAA